MIFLLELFDDLLLFHKGPFKLCVFCFQPSVFIKQFPLIVSSLPQSLIRSKILSFLEFHLLIHFRYLKFVFPDFFHQFDVFIFTFSPLFLGKLKIVHQGFVVVLAICLNGRVLFLMFALLGLKQRVMMVLV
jgi:hypothetical protein